jgi:hypothetical protein
MPDLHLSKTRLRDLINKATDIYMSVEPTSPAKGKAEWLMWHFVELLESEEEEGV